MTDSKHANETPTFGFLVSDVARMLRENFRITAPELGLTLAQARVLVHLSRNEGISQVALSSILEIQPITLLRQIDRLEKAQLVERRAHPSDRRAQQLYLTPRSQTLVTRIFERSAQDQERVMAGLEAAERVQLHAWLMRIKGNLAQMAAATQADESPTRAVTKRRR
jgi:MarR family transcriptional regulator, transcriptional regulator for hemolysin